MEAFVIYLFLAAFVLASTALSWWGGYQMGCEEGAVPSDGNLENMYGLSTTTALTSSVVPLS